MKLLTPGEHKRQEDLITQIYSQELQAGDVFLDIGANIGHHTWRMAESVGETGKGFAVEPVPDFRERLNRVLAIKKVNWVEVLPLAVSDICSNKKFYYRPDFPGWSSLLEEHHHPEDQLKNHIALDVKVTTLDTLFGETMEALKFIKLDIEGSELPALRGGRGIIQTFKPVIVLENVVPVAAELNGYSALEFFDFFENLDYVLYDLFGTLMTRETFETLQKDYSLPIYYLGLPKTHPAALDPKAYYTLSLE